MRTIDAMKKLARNDGRFTHVYTKKELSELFNETGSKLNGTLKSLIKENILNRALTDTKIPQHFSITRGNDEFFKEK